MVCTYLLPIASLPVKAMEQLVRFLVLVDTDSVVLHLLSVEKEESGTETWIQSPVMVCNWNSFIFLLYESKNFFTKKAQ